MWSKLTEYTVVGGLVACIPFGAGMAYYTNDPDWLWFCLPLAFFLS
jgi:hypothetical protein